MPESIDDQTRRWKAKPDAAGAIALCDALRRETSTLRAALVDEVGKLAVEKYANDGRVLMAVARLYADVERLSDAQGVLLTAGRVAPRDAMVYRLLGEVLLRRGDAERAEKALGRAKQLGANDPETAMWIERAKVFKPVQAKAGARAVAVEVKSTTVVPVTPHPHLLAAARQKLQSVDDDAVTRANMQLPDIAEMEATIRRSGMSGVGGLSVPTDPTMRQKSERPITAPYGSLAIPPIDPLPGVTGPMGVSGSARSVAADASPLLPEPTPAPRARVPQARPFPDDSTEVTDPSPEMVARARQPVAVGGEAASIPAARDVLDALTNAGVFEPREAASGPIKWDKPDGKARRRSAIALAVGLVVFVGGSVGVLHEIRRRRAEAHDQAEIVLAKVETDLASSKASLLPEIETAIGHAFELDSRSPRAAQAWLEERALKGLLSGGGEIAFEDAVARALEVKVPEEKVAYARVAAFLFQGDTGGAAALMPKWDGPAATEPLYQLITGATLERAGDIHELERYLAATKLGPNIVLSDILLARATAIDGDPAKAADLAKQFRAKYPDRPEGAALVALAWARDPTRGETPPPDVAEAIAHAGDLPLPLVPIPHALAAVTALDKHAFADAKAAIEKGLAVATDPGMASWLGSLSLETKDEPLIRKAALLAVTFSAVYAPARVLAARIALLSGRLDEALKATEDLDPTSPDVAIVRAAAAYERVDADAMGRALEAVPVDLRKLPVFSAVNLGPAELLGHVATTWPRGEAPQKLREISSDEAPWSDLLAMDAALDLGLTDVADAIAASWKGTEDKPLKALRLSRLARYENHLDQADQRSKAALDGATVTPRTLVERVMVLVAKNRATDVGPLLARYPLVLGPASSWLSAYALATSGKVEEARGRTAQLDVPPALAPSLFRVMAAVSLAAMKDKKRGEPLLAEIMTSGTADPDVLAAAATLGMRVPNAPAAAPAPRKGRR